jgi:hypothetical protein
MQRAASVPTRAPRRAWAPWAAAAAVLVAALAVVTVRGASGPDFRIAALQGRAERLDRRTGLWRPAAPGEFLSPGDRLLTSPGSLVRLEAEGGTIHLDGESAIDVLGSRSLALDRGRLFAEFPTALSVPLRVRDLANNVVAVRQGRVEVGLREVRALVGGSRETRSSAPDLPSPHPAVSHRLVARVAEGAAELGGSLDQRLRAAAGQEGTFDFGGQPSAGPLDARSVGAWAAAEEGVR